MNGTNESPHRPRVHVYRDSQGGWRFRLVAGNGEIVADGESYTRKWNAKRAARRIWPHTPIIDT